MGQLLNINKTNNNRKFPVKIIFLDCDGVLNSVNG